LSDFLFKNGFVEGDGDESLDAPAANRVDPCVLPRTPGRLAVGSPSLSITPGQSRHRPTPLMNNSMGRLDENLGFHRRAASAECLVEPPNGNLTREVLEHSVEQLGESIGDAIGPSDSISQPPSPSASQAASLANNSVTDFAAKFKVEPNDPKGDSCASKWGVHDLVHWWNTQANPLSVRFSSFDVVLG
jgi:hypothetical protein